ncbi:MAG: hypothetical protein KF824_13180 [Fimbriimonadaceae bacterium]|nr:MAG: hypothetical protein KF824_13180 [Fimbriimonadaceae bacterium]
MLWRKGYVTERVTGFCAKWDGSLQTIPEVVIGFYHADQLTNVELWCRLLRADFGDDSDWRLLNLGVSSEELESAFPPSLSKRVIQGNPEDWPFDREFAWRADLVMVGPPTEDAWEEFSDCLFSLEN